MGQQRRQFSPESKADAVALVRSSGGAAAARSAPHGGTRRSPRRLTSCTATSPGRAAMSYGSATRLTSGPMRGGVTWRRWWTHAHGGCWAGPSLTTCVQSSAWMRSWPPSRPAADGVTSPLGSFPTPIMARNTRPGSCGRRPVAGHHTVDAHRGRQPRQRHGRAVLLRFQARGHRRRALRHPHRGTESHFHLAPLVQSDQAP